MPDDRTLIVTLADPVPFFPAVMAFPPFFPMHEPSMQPFMESDGLHYDQDFTRPPYLVTNGPYRLAEWNFKRRLRMIASDFTGIGECEEQSHRSDLCRRWFGGSADV